MQRVCRDDAKELCVANDTDLGDSSNEVNERKRWNDKNIPIINKTVDIPKITSIPKFIVRNIRIIIIYLPILNAIN